MIWSLDSVPVPESTVPAVLVTAPLELLDWNNLNPRPLGLSSASLDLKQWKILTFWNNISKLFNFRDGKKKLLLMSLPQNYPLSRLLKLVMWCVVFRINYCHGVTLLQCHPVVTVTFKSAYHMNILAARQKILRFIVSFIVMVAYDGSYRSPANNSQHRWSQLAMVCWQEIFMMVERCWTLFCCHTTEHYFWWHQCCGHVLVTICVTIPVPGLLMTLLRCPRSQVGVILCHMGSVLLRSGDDHQWVKERCEM